MSYLDDSTTVTMTNRQWFVVSAALSAVLKNGLHARRAGLPRTVMEDDLKSVEQVIAQALNAPKTGPVEMGR